MSSIILEGSAMPPMADSGSPTVTNVPVPKLPRNTLLDCLRGIGLLGALTISIWWYGGFSANQQTQLLLHPHGGNYRLFATISLLFEGKMMGLVALVFGVGLVLFLSKKQEENATAIPDLFIRRHLWLIGFGLINALVFLSTNDLLFHFGIMGILLYPFARMSAKGLFIGALITTLIFCGKNYWRYADDRSAYKKYLTVQAVEKTFAKDSLQKKAADSTGNAVKDSVNKKGNPNVVAVIKDTTVKKEKDSLSKAALSKDTLTKEQKDDKEKWEGIVKNMKFDPKKDDGKNKDMREESYSKLWEHLLPDIQNRQASWTYRYGVWALASIIFLGMALFKKGFFTNGLSTNTFLALALAGISLGLLLGWYRLYFNNATLLDYSKYITKHPLPYHLFVPFERVFMVVGYASLTILLLKTRVFAAIGQSFAAVGRMALTNYLLQSIMCLLFFTGYGMGYFGKLDQWQFYVVVAEIWMIQIVFSLLWFRQFDCGPAEWLLRSLVHWRRLPFKKQADDNLPVQVHYTMAPIADSQPDALPNESR